VEPDAELVPGLPTETGFDAVCVPAGVVPLADEPTVIAPDCPASVEDVELLPPPSCATAFDPVALFPLPLMPTGNDADAADPAMLAPAVGVADADPTCTAPFEPDDELPPPT